MSLCKTKSRKLQSLVIASVLALSITNFVHAEETWTQIKPDYNLDDSLVHNPGSVDFAGNYDITNMDFSKEFQIKLPNGSLYYTPTTKNVTWQEYGSTIFEGGQLYFIGLHTHTGYDSDVIVTKLGDAESILSGGISEDEVKDLIDDAIHHVEGDMTVAGSQEVTGDQQVDGSQTVKSVA